MPTSNSDIWATPDRSVAETYAGLKAIQSPTFQAGLSSIRTNASNLAEVNGRGAQWKSVRTNPRKLTGLQVDDPNINRPLKGTDEIAEAVKGSGNYQGTLFRNTKDDAVKTRGNEATDTYNILGSRPDVNIRDTDAAFDPEYTGPNIMGGLLAGGVGLGALSQSEDADASVASLAARGLRLVEGKSPAATPSDNLFNIVDGQGGKIGGAEFYVTPDGDLSAYNMRLNPEHRGSGIMSEAYDAVEEITGRMIEPSDVLTDDGMKFWIRRDPSRMRELQQGGRFDHLEEDLFDSLFEEALRPKR